MDDSNVPFLLQPTLDPTNLPNATIQQPGRLRLRPLPFQHPRHHLQPISFPLTHRDPVSVHPLSSSQGKRTFLTS
jgi:hypothetical protein